MEIRQLEYFLAVARTRNFSHAAELIPISQPTLSRTIMELESELGQPLFIRTKREVRLTTFGETFLQKAQPLVNGFHALAVSGKQQAENAICGKIYVGIPPITAIVSFGQLLGRFKKQYPYIEVNLLEYGPRTLARMLRNGLLDFAIFKALDDQAFQWFWIEKDTHDVVLPEGHPLADKAEITYEELAQEPLLIYSSDYMLHDKILDHFHQQGVMPHIALETTQQDLMKVLVANGCGVAILPHKLCAQFAGLQSSLVCRPLADKKLTMQLALVYVKGQPLSREGELFRDFAKQEILRNGNDLLSE